MLTSLASRSRNQAIAPHNFQKQVQLLVQLNISAGCGHGCEVNKVITCDFVEYHAYPLLLSLQIMAVLT